MDFLWEKFGRPAMFGLDAEAAHELGMKALQWGLSAPYYSDPRSFDLGPVERFRLEFPNPVGIAAGLDKNAVAVNQLASLGFGFVEVGTVTFEAQPGNPRPRMFRLPEDQGVINRLGFNNEGAEAVAARLSKLKRKGIVGVNIGKNKDVAIEAATENYLTSFNLLADHADYVAINISSPNTPNLRELQRYENLDELLGTLSRAAKNRVPLLVKIAPDLSETEIESAVGVCLRYEIAGMIATNTTISRDGLTSKNIESIGAGGLSGRPLRQRATEVIKTVYRYSKGKLPIIGVGGVFTGDDAFEKIAAGASLVQAYTGFIYRGPMFAKDVNKRLAQILKERGFSTMDEAVGSGVSNG
ncbi:MAG: quinone-dependent dihydroorotate dehydrogenase [Pyrinomonadaceae bacterium]